MTCLCLKSYRRNEKPLRSLRRTKLVVLFIHTFNSIRRSLQNMHSPQKYRRQVPQLERLRSTTPSKIQQLNHCLRLLLMRSLSRNHFLPERLSQFHCPFHLKDHKLPRSHPGVVITNMIPLLQALLTSHRTVL